MMSLILVIQAPRDPICSALVIQPSVPSVPRHAVVPPTAARFERDDAQGRDEMTSPGFRSVEDDADGERVGGQPVRPGE